MQINWFKNKYLCNNLQKIESVLKSVYEDTNEYYERSYYDPHPKYDGGTGKYLQTYKQYY